MHSSPIIVKVVITIIVISIAIITITVIIMITIVITIIIITIIVIIAQVLLKRFVFKLEAKPPAGTDGEGWAVQLASTCFNTIYLPTYSSDDEMRQAHAISLMTLRAVCSSG